MLSKILLGFVYLVLNINPALVPPINGTHKEAVKQEQAEPAPIQESIQPISSEEKAHRFGELVASYVKGRKSYSANVYSFLLQHVSSDKVVLDIGCGTGISTRGLAVRFKQVYGCDHDEKMLEAAKNSSPDQISFGIGSAYQLPYQDGQFGIVTMFSSFHWFCDAKAAQEISRVLEKDGFVYVVGGSGAPLFKEEAREIMQTAVGHEIAHPMRAGYDPEKVLIENGFTIVEKQEFSVMKTYTVEETLQHFQSLSVWNDVKQAGKEEQVLTQLRDLCLKHVNPDDGLIHQEVKEKVLLAQKRS